MREKRITTTAASANESDNILLMVSSESRPISSKNPCGTLFVTSIIEKLWHSDAEHILTNSKNTVRIDKDPHSEGWSEDQEAAFAELSHTVHSLLSISVLTSKALPRIASKNKKTPPLITTTDQALSILSSLEFIRRTGYGYEAIVDYRGCPKIALVYIAYFYFSAYKRGYDNDDTVCNNYLHETLWKFTRGTRLDASDMDKCLKELSYRLGQMSAADRYLALVHVPKPDGKGCAEYNTHNFRKTMETSVYRKWDLMISSFGPVLFPQSFSRCEFEKGTEYLIAAMHTANISLRGAEKKLEVLSKVVSDDVEDQMELMSREVHVMIKRRKLFEACGSPAPVSMSITRLLWSFSEEKEIPTRLSLRGSLTHRLPS
jgi:hypothetical protein